MAETGPGISVYPDDVRIFLGMGNHGLGYRRTLINQSFAVMVLSLHEYSGTTARDITGNGNDATLNGSGATRAVSLVAPEYIPDDIMGTRMTGGQFYETPDDSGLGARTLNLSLAGGSMDIVLLLWDVEDDHSYRCIINKQESHSNGDGWHVAVQDGEIHFVLSVSSSLVFDISGGYVGDGGLYVVHCCYEPEESRARIFLVNVSTGDVEVVASTTGVTTEPEVTGADLRVGMFADGMAGDGSGFKGVVAMAMIGREGNPTLAEALAETLTWYDVSEDVDIAAMPVEWTRGMSGSGIQDTVAQPGIMTFALDNSTRNSQGLQGLYSIGHENCRDGFDEGIPCKLVITYGDVEYTRFKGIIKSAPPSAGIYGQQIVTVTVVDWMYVATRAFTGALPVQTDALFDECMGAVVDRAERPPAGVDLHLGSTIFPFVFDSSRGEDDAPVSELVRLTGSERSWAYVLGNGTLVGESRTTRQMETESVATFDFQHALMPKRDIDRIYNILRITVNPRRADSVDTTVLATMPTTTADHAVPPGGEIVLEAGYTNPTVKTQRVGGTDMQAPVATTDYTMNSDPGGAGTDMTADFEVIAEYGANRVQWTIRNTSPEITGYITKLQARGRGLYTEDPQTVVVRDKDSINRWGARPLPLTLHYVGSIAEGKSAGEFIKGLFAEQVEPLPESFSVMANYDHATMLSVLAMDVGRRFMLEEDLTAIDGTLGYYVQQMHERIDPGNIITDTFKAGLPIPTGAVWILGEEGFSELGETTYVGY